jgi:prepilin-type N-terminal cleavage/methylation domain-containing protein
MFKNNFLKNNKGFTLVETLVAISIFSVSAIALLTILSGGITDINYVKNKFIADNLAVEGIEYVRNIRDTNALYSSPAPTGWQAFLSSFSQCVKNVSDGCYFDNSSLNYSNRNRPILALSIVPCSQTCPLLKLNNTTGRFEYNINNNATSSFSRKIEVELPSDLNNGNELKIYSTVTWREGSRNYETVLSTSLFNWMQP